MNEKCSIRRDDVIPILYGDSDGSVFILELTVEEQWRVCAEAETLVFVDPQRANSMYSIYSLLTYKHTATISQFIIIVMFRFKVFRNFEEITSLSSSSSGKIPIG